jgi:hypothetical protein
VIWWGFASSVAWTRRVRVLPLQPAPWAREPPVTCGQAQLENADQGISRRYEALPWRGEQCTVGVL